MRHIQIYLAVLISSLLFITCSDAYLGLQQVKTDSVSPDKVTVTNVVPKSGALEIFFTLPEGHPDIEQIVATYKNRKGNLMEFKASRYSSSILVEGLIGSEETVITLVCMDTSGNASPATTVTATALPSPVEIAYNSLIVEPAFGGARVMWENKEANQLVIHVLTEDTLEVGKSTLVEDITKTIYNNDSSNTFAYIRHYPPSEYQFGFIVSDKWGNVSDTLLSTVIPFKEDLLDYNLPDAVPFFNPTYQNSTKDYNIHGVNPATGIQNDANCHATWAGPHTIFDGETVPHQLYAYKFVRNLSDPDPAKHVLVQNAFLTYDLNVDIRLSRVVMMPRPHPQWAYQGLSLKRFRIWGTDDANEDRWQKFPENWTLIGEYEGPECATPGNPTQEEMNRFYEGVEFTIRDENLNPEANPTQSFRYMRLELLETYNPLAVNYAMNEFIMYGDILNTYK